MKAYVFPGQGAQFTGMGKSLYDSSPKVKSMFDQANGILGFDILSIMFEGTAEELAQTKVTQPAIFLHSVAEAAMIEDFKPEMVAGHSLGEFSALVAAGTMTFEDGLKLVAQRAFAMQEACEMEPSTMAAILNLSDEVVENICLETTKNTNEIVVPANYNCPGQLVISGSVAGINAACDNMKAAGAKRALVLQVGGAFHSPFMEPARAKLAAAIEATNIQSPICPIYQNVNAEPSTNVETIKSNLIAQLTAPVRWTQSVQNMVANGATSFTECGPGKVLQGLIKKISPDSETTGF